MMGMSESVTEGPWHVPSKQHPKRNTHAYGLKSWAMAMAAMAYGT